MRPTFAEQWGATRRGDRYEIRENIMRATLCMDNASTLEEWQFHADFWWISALLYVSLVSRTF